VYDAEKLSSKNTEIEGADQRVIKGKQAIQEKN